MRDYEPFNLLGNCELCGKEARLTRFHKINQCEDCMTFEEHPPKIDDFVYRNNTCALQELPPITYGEISALNRGVMRLLSKPKCKI